MRKIVTIASLGVCAMLAGCLGPVTPRAERIAAVQAATGKRQFYGKATYCLERIPGSNGVRGVPTYNRPDGC